MNKKLIDILYRSFDAELTPDEQIKLERGLATFPELRAEKEKIESLREKIAETKEVSFGPFFSEKVMNRINSDATKDQEDSFADSLFAVFRPIAIAAGLLIFALLSYNIKTTENFSLSGALGQEKETITQVIDPAYMISLE